MSNQTLNLKGTLTCKLSLLSFCLCSPDAKIPTKLQLEDNGNGLVDLTQNDGIYSAVFPYIGDVAGFFSVQVIADDNEQQAMLPKSPQSIQLGMLSKKSSKWYKFSTLLN